jgi:AraC-like DNA-binding protein
MIPTRQVDRETHIADILLKSEAALDELHQYYKVGRHKGEFVEKPYFLLSHCAHLLFSLWLTESESPTGLFEYSSHLNALISKLDFGSLRYTDYKRRALDENTLQEHLKNEPKWFNFWLKVLDKQDGTRPLDCQAFAQNILGFVSHPGFLEGKVPRKSRKNLANLLKTDAGAQIFQQSMSVLEELIAAVIFQFTNLDQGRHTREQLVSLICMLRQVRRTIVSEAPAEGPYVLLSNKSWGIPSTLFRIQSGRMRGTLKVVLKRNGGSIVCAYNWTSDAPSKCRSWMRDMSALTHAYEEELFKTWSYDTGEPLHSPEPSTDSKAYWLVQNTEAKRLRAIFRHIEMVLKTLAINPQCRGLIADVARLSMDNSSDWQGTRLAWTYIRKLDQLLNKVKFAYREARVLGGNNPGEEVISNMWPPEPSVAREVEESAPRESDVPERPRELPSPKTPSPLESATPTEETRVEEHPSQGSDAEKEQTLPLEPTVESSARTDSTQPQDQTLPSVLQPHAIWQKSGDFSDKAEKGQGPDGPSAAPEQDQCSSISLTEDEICESAEEAQEQPVAAALAASESDQKSESQESEYLTPAATEPVAEEDLTADEPQFQTGRAGEAEETEETVASLDGEPEGEQNLDEPPAVAKQEEYSSTSRFSEAISDDPALTREESVAAELATSESDQKSGSQESDSQTPASTEPADEDLTADEPQFQTDQVAEAEETEEAVASLDGEPEGEQNLDEPPADEELTSEEPEFRTDRATEVQESQEVVAEFDDEVAKEQSPDEPSAVEQEEKNSASVLSETISDGSEQVQEEPATAEFTADDLSQASEPEESHCQTPTPVEHVAEDLTADEPEFPADPAGEAEDTEEPVASLDGETKGRQEAVEESSSAEQETDLTEVPPCLSSDQSPYKPQEHDYESVAAKAQETASPTAEPSGQEQERTPEVAPLTNEPQPEVSSFLLRQKLSQWHHPTDGPIKYNALSLKQLRQDLGWKQSEVQCMMTELFGRRPFTVYKEKCKDKTVCEFLRDSVHTQTEARKDTSEDSRSSAVIAIATSDQAFCQYISQKPQSTAGTSEEAVDTVDAERGADSKAPEQASETNPTDMDRQLLERLLEHHHVPRGPACDNPLSLKKLQQDLAWKASEVQRSMTNIFGRRPFTAYKKKCGDGMIGDFLEDCDCHRLEKADALHQMVRQQASQAV